MTTPKRAHRFFQNDPPRPQPHWLISYRYRPCYLTERGVVVGDRCDTVSLEDLPVELFVLAMRARRVLLDHTTFDGTGPHQRADEIEIIYSAFKVDAPGVITKLKDIL